MTPDVQVRLRGGNIFQSTTNGKTVTGICLDAKVWNTGAPTAAVEWKLVVAVSGDPDGVKLRSVCMPDTLTLNGATNDLITASASLERKCEGVALGIVPLVGRLLFYTDLPQESVMSANTVLTLVCEDSYSNLYTTTQRMGDWAR